MVHAFLRTDEFDEWLRTLRDPIGKARILARIRAAELGHFGDHASVGDGVFELRVHIGPGYRVYYWRQGTVTYWLLCGGDKSTQSRDIRRAKALRKTLESEP
jgi:putative addiction module killer protein